MADGDDAPAPPLEQPALVMVGVGNPDPLHNFADIQQAINDMAADDPNTVPMAEMLGLVARQLCSFTLAQKLTKKHNSVLLASARKAKVDECVTKLSNLMSVRVVKLNYRVPHLVEDILAVLSILRESKLRKLWQLVWRRRLKQEVLVHKMIISQKRNLYKNS